MINNATECKDCVKQDVCRLKNKYAYAVKVIATSNTTDEVSAIHEAKDNKCCNTLF
jgi:hypothetical protein